MPIAGVFGTSFETILNITGATTMTATQANTNLVRVISGMAATLTLPAISAMVASQNLRLIIVNQSGSGGTLTIAANSADSIEGQTTAAVATGVTAYHDGLHTWTII